LDARPEESSSHTRGTSTCCIMRILRSVTHACMVRRAGAKRTIWQAGRKDEPFLFGSRCPSSSSPLTHYTYSSTRRKVSAQPASSDHGPPRRPHEVLISSGGSILQVTCTTQQKHLVYTGRGISLPRAGQPARGGRVSRGLENEPRAHSDMIPRTHM